MLANHPNVLSGGGVATNIIGGTGLFADGSQSAPSISFANDPDTGFYLQTSNQIALAFGGFYRGYFSVTSNDFIVRSSVSDAQLTLGSAGNVALQATQTNQNITLTPSGTGVVQIGSASGTLLLVGTSTNSNNGAIQLATHTTSAGGIGFGTDTSLYRYNVGQLSLEAPTTFAPQLHFSVSGASKARLYHNGGVDTTLETLTALPLKFGVNSVLALTLDTALKATFAGNIAIPTAGTLTFGGSDSQITGNSGGQTQTFSAGSFNLYLRNTALLVGGDSVLADGAGILQVANHNIAATSSIGINLFNRTDATSLVPVQMSPRFTFAGKAWDTSASKRVEFSIENLPANAATPTGTLKFGYSLNGAALTYPMTLTSAGVATFAGNILATTSQFTNINDRDNTVTHFNFSTSVATYRPDSGAAAAGGSATQKLVIGATNQGVELFWGSGAPTVSGRKGSLYMRIDGTGINDRMYVNTDNSTTWTSVVTVA